VLLECLYDIAQLLSRGKYAITCSSKTATYISGGGVLVYARLEILEDGRIDHA
jgi:hypothetical protein